MTKTLVITGGSRGIGEATIHRFQQDNWRIINLSRTRSKIDNVTNIEMDLSSTSDVLQQGEKVKNLLQGNEQICLVHNAAFYEPDCLDTLDIANLNKSLTVNIISPVILNQLISPFMSAGSSIIYIGTTLARKAVPGSASYAISKHGVVGLMRVTCQDLQGRQIRSCCVSPGLVDTKLLHDTMSKDMQQYLLNNVVIGKRLMEPKEIADVIYFCALSPCLNGIVIDANLGQIAD